ncbi:XtrA/YqaO family protein [Lysinibacillus pakistanensis]|uniref:XtrA/YqaO family protein n=1 Tax=Lysinibacillus pakistanensis TaxID=759811 RepID=A0AAX3X523_9BACI|nr:XtrA/YqaO family protein [Lysinibacillus pakistanensis]MDM5233359.1 XtrA/YqaO family protein [Lysinibacillus pakistanensis]WHY48833.1 XtrA/YqaO family protein [Lysinibacillus pakistanensis]WHY53845.1 XtrA/YqaO family protein [Lysinibacillus pakistanensis]
MRLKQLEISNEGLLQVDIMELPENCVIVLSDGIAKFSELPAHAKTKIVTYQGKVKRVEFDEGEEF